MAGSDINDTVGRIRDLLLSQSRAGRLRNLMDSIYGSSPVSTPGMLGMQHQQPSSQTDPALERYMAGKESAARGVPLEAPAFSPDDLIGSGLLKGMLGGGAALGGILRAASPTEIFGRELAPLAIRAQQNLSPQAKRFSENWNLNWGYGQGKFMVSPEAAEIDRAFDPVREKMRRIYGDNIPLFRGEVNGPSQADRHLFSWTPDEDLAKKFAYGVRYIPPRISQKELDNYILQFDKVGRVKMGHNTYIKNKSDPDYYDIYSDGQHLTDGDDFVSEALRFKTERDEWIDKFSSRGVVHSKNVPVSDTFWIPTGMNLQQPEIITRSNPRAVK